MTQPGGQPTPGAGVADFRAIALGAGYPVAEAYDDLEDLEEDLPSILAGLRPALVVLKVASLGRRPNVEGMTPLHDRGYRSGTTWLGTNQAALRPVGRDYRRRARWGGYADNWQSPELEGAVGRVKQEVEVAGHRFWALFDTGAMNTYVVDEVASLLPTMMLERPEPSALGGRTQQVEKECLLSCHIEGRRIGTHARVLPEIGSDETGRRVEILIGALAMQQWGIIPVPKDERLDMSNYPDMFVEF